MRVLLIEDDPAVSRALDIALSAEKFNIYATDLGEDDLHLAEFHDYDIILLDLNLPDMCGFDVLKRMRASKVKTPVLVLSGDPRIETRVRSSVWVPMIMSPSHSTAMN